MQLCSTSVNRMSDHARRETYVVLGYTRGTALGSPPHATIPRAYKSTTSSCTTTACCYPSVPKLSTVAESSAPAESYHKAAVQLTCTEWRWIMHASTSEYKALSGFGPSHGLSCAEQGKRIAVAATPLREMHSITRASLPRSTANHGLLRAGCERAMRARQALLHAATAAA